MASIPKTVAPPLSSHTHSSKPPDFGLPQSGTTEAYHDWLAGFTKERLRVLYWVGFIANPFWAALDYLQGDPFLDLLPFRSLMELVYLSGLLALRYQMPTWVLRTLLIAWIAVPNICIAEMTIVLGGFTSQYYNGLNLVILAAGVIVPISWRSHLAAQGGSLLYYFGANTLRGASTSGWLVAVENSMFLIWTCVGIQIAVILYERLQKAEFEGRQKLIVLDRLKSEFFANISHELRTPLTLTLGTFKALLKTALTSEARDLIQTGVRNASRLLFLINELLDLARFDSGRVHLEKRWIDLCRLVRTVAANFESSGRRRIHIYGLSQPVSIEADPRALKKVFYNLLSNAFKFSDPDDGQVWLRLTDKSTAVELEVEDNGIGIPEDHLPRIFDRFTQVEGQATRRFEGSGIGLALVKEVVTHHGGRVGVESTVGHGSKFTITLPRPNEPPELYSPVQDDEMSDLPVADLGRGKTEAADPSSLVHRPDLPLVLTADDNADMREYLRQILGGSYRVALAQDGAEAIHLAKTIRPDLIITDAMMPRMSGYDLLKAVREDDNLRSIPVIFVTARAGMEARVETLEAGADDYLSKPFDEQEVLVRVANLIRTRAQERELATLQQEKFKRFLPPQLASLLTEGTADEVLKSHRQDITVLFADLRGFTAFAESAEPEDVMGVLRQYHAEMGRLIMEYHGTLERFAGDGLMVYFNDPVPVVNHQEKAIRMALGMQDRIRELQDDWHRRAFDLGVGIGMASGYATLGVIGFEGRTDYAAIGTVTNLAARLCAEAAHGQILVTQRCLEWVKDLVQATFMGDLVLKGFREPVRTYNVTGLIR